MLSAPNAAVRRFLVAGKLILLARLAALGVLLYLVMKLLGGS